MTDYAKLIGLALFVSALFVAVASVVPPIQHASSTYTSNVIANVAVSNTCYVSTPSSVNFGSTLPSLGYVSNVAVTDTDNGGNAQATISVSGVGGSGVQIGDWFSGSNVIPVSNTLWSATPQSSYAGTALTNSLASTSITITAPNVAVTSQSANVYFGVAIPAGAPSGTYTQNVLFQNSCGATSSSYTDFVTSVQGVCFVSLSTNSLSFGSLSPGSNYATNVVVTDTDNGGNTQSTVLIAATSGSGATLGDWIGPGSNVIPVSNTLWSATPQSSYTGSALTNSLASTSISILAPNVIDPSQSANVYFGLGLPAGTAGGAYTQNIEIENSC